MCSQCPPVDFWDDGMDWNSQPPELKALGKRGAERVIKRMWNKAFEQARADVDAEHATMTPEQIRQSERAAHDYLEAVAAENGPAKRWFDKK